MQAASPATATELLQYEQLGFFSRERIFAARELAELRDAAEAAHRRVLKAAERGEGGPTDRIDNQRYQIVCGSTLKWEWRADLRAVRSLEPAHHLDARLEALIDDPRLWEPCCALVGSEQLSLFSDKLNMKRPGGAPFPWHQESPYWVYGAERVERIASVLVYLDDASRDNGCLWVIPGSHRHGILPGLKDRGVLGALYTDVQGVEGEPLALELPAGSALWFHPDLVHGSQGNRSATSRRVFVAAYQPAGLRRWRLDQVRPVRAPAI
jgi:hypothetical protein